jgi:membrane protease subunit (stomatin/prohibitin family)
MVLRRRPLLRAAVVGGGAYAAGRGMGRRAEQRDQAESDQEAPTGTQEQQQAPAASDSSQMLDQLNQLAALHEQGALTDAEFSTAKGKLLGN